MSVSEENVFWLGGPPCSGKTSVSRILASRFDLDVYHVDDAFETHTQQLSPIDQPALTNWCRSSWNERWMRPIDVLLRDVMSCYQEHFALIYKDILRMAKAKPLLVEGAALLPKQVASVLSKQTHAIWLIPTAGFQTKQYSRREWASAIVAECDNPALAFSNWMQRDIRFSEWIEAEAAALDLPILKVDESKTVEENALVVAKHFRFAAGQ